MAAIPTATNPRCPRRWRVPRITKWRTFVAHRQPKRFRVPGPTPPIPGIPMHVSGGVAHWLYSTAL
jgi:hypothetical protein